MLPRINKQKPGWHDPIRFKPANASSIGQAVCFSSTHGLAFFMAGVVSFSLSLPVCADTALEALVDKGNQAANRQDFVSAIQAYEQAIQKAPSQAILKKNLAILYANQAVTLQEQKKFAQALSLLDKAEALSPKTGSEHKNIQDTRGSVLFAQAMDFKENKESLSEADYAQVRTWLTQAIQLSPNEPAFKKALASNYLDQAYQLAIAEKYDEAAPLLEKGIGYDPNSKALKQSLANVYLGIARNHTQERDQWIEKALAHDNSPKIQNLANQLKASGNASPTNSFAKAPTEAASKAPPELSQLSVSEMVQSLENQLQITPDKQANLNNRLDSIEKQVLGKPQSGAMATRAKTVYIALMGSGSSVLDSNVNLVQAPANTSENSYLNEIFKITDGKVVRWGRFPIRVYFETPENQPLYKPEYKEAALAGFNLWKSKTNDFIQFIEIKNPQAADIIVNWQDAYQDRFADPEKAPAVYKDYTPPKNTRLVSLVRMASMVTPGYFSLAPQAAAAALQYQQYKKQAVIMEESKIHLGLNPTQNLSSDGAKTVIQNMAAKEFGHALGLKACSPNADDLLYPALRSDTIQYPSARDLQTLRELYNRPPNIILNVH